MSVKLIADLHTHTIASTHAYGTIQEMVTAAKENGLCTIAITDHGRTMPSAPGTWYFENLGIIPSTWMGVRVLKGIEANIIDYNGTLDLDDYTMQSLEWVVASIHSMAISGEYSFEACTNAYLQVAKDKRVNVIGHSGLEDFKYDYEKVLPEFARNGKLVEINEGTFNVRKSSIKNCVEIAKICKKQNIGVVVNSDAHFQLSVGNAPRALKMLEEIDFPSELIINADQKRLEDYLRQCGISLR